MASLLELHEAIEARLATISGLRTFDHPPKGAAPPFAFVELGEWAPEAMSRAGTKSYTFNVYVLTANSARPQDGYRPLMEYADSVGPHSVEMAIWDGNEGSQSFAGLPKTNAHVASFNVLGTTPVDGVEMYGGRFVVEVRTQGA
jgi:hypothetical protein